MNDFGPWGKRIKRSENDFLHSDSSFEKENSTNEIEALKLKKDAELKRLWEK